jgi:hypothetical protein
MSRIGRRGFLGMLAGAMGAVGLDRVPGLGLAARTIERFHARETTLVVTGLDIFAPIMNWGVALLPASRRPEDRRILHCGMNPPQAATSLIFQSGIDLADGASLEVVGQAAYEGVVRPVLFVRNIRGTLVVDRPAGAWRCVPSIAKYVVESTRPPKIEFTLDYEEF